MRSKCVIVCNNKKKQINKQGNSTSIHSFITEPSLSICHLIAPSQTLPLPYFDDYNQ